MNCKAATLFLIVPFLIFGTDLSKKFGIDFMTGGSSSVGFIYHFNKVYAISPEISFHYTEFENYYVTDTDYQVGCYFNQQFYLPAINSIDHFIFLDAGAIIWEDINIVAGAGYGLQYSFNDNIAVFGKLGLHSEFFNWGNSITFRKSGVGMIIYF